MAWTRITDPDEAARFLPAWLGRRMIGLRGRFGLLLTTGDVLRITSIAALHESSSGAVLLDVHFDHAGVPDGVDLSWRTKHFLGAPLPGAIAGTVNLAHVVAAVEFLAEEPARPLDEIAVPAGSDARPDTIGSLEDTIERANTLGEASPPSTEPARSSC